MKPTQDTEQYHYPIQRLGKKLRSTVTLVEINKEIASILGCLTVFAKRSWKTVIQSIQILQLNGLLLSSSRKELVTPAASHSFAQVSAKSTTRRA